MILRARLAKLCKRTDQSSVLRCSRWRACPRRDVVEGEGMMGEMGISGEGGSLMITACTFTLKIPSYFGILHTRMRGARIAEPCFLRAHYSDRSTQTRLEWRSAAPWRSVQALSEPVPRIVVCWVGLDASIGLPCMENPCANSYPCITRIPRVTSRVRDVPLHSQRAPREAVGIVKAYCSGTKCSPPVVQEDDTWTRLSTHCVC